jgi:hypothetical protein
MKEINLTTGGLPDVQTFIGSTANNSREKSAEVTVAWIRACERKKSKSLTNCEGLNFKKCK